MQFESFEAFLAMGGYGIYVWSCFAVSLTAMALVWWHSQRKMTRLKEDFQRQQQREEKLDMAKNMEGTL